MLGMIFLHIFRIISKKNDRLQDRLLDLCGTRLSQTKLYNT